MASAVSSIRRYSSNSRSSMVNHSRRSSFLDVVLRALKQPVGRGRHTKPLRWMITGTPDALAVRFSSFTMYRDTVRGELSVTLRNRCRCRVT